MSSSDSAPFAAVSNFYSVVKCCLLPSMLIVVIGLVRGSMGLSSKMRRACFFSFCVYQDAVTVCGAKV